MVVSVDGVDSPVVVDSRVGESGSGERGSGVVWRDGAVVGTLDAVKHARTTGRN